MRKSFQKWLNQKMGMTYTQYSKLPTARKAEIYKQYPWVTL